jgi:uncharacterized protein YjbI with pentapeptide repeats
MANEEHLAILRQGVEVWNRWREEHPGVAPDLSGASLRRLPFVGYNLCGAVLREADLSRADLSQADLRDALLGRANLELTRLAGADLRGADLQRAMLLETDLSDANLTGCRVYGASVWALQLAGSVQRSLIITPRDEPTITADDLEVAQFIYLLLNNQKIRDVIDTITSKVVLILGRFSSERKAVLDAIREALRHSNYLPVMFDFEMTHTQTTMETVSTLAHMARFVIADLSDARSVLQELRGIVPNLPSVPVQPLLRESDYEPGMLDFFKRFPWFLEVYRYRDLAALMGALADGVIGPAEAKVKELRGI